MEIYLSEADMHRAERDNIKDRATWAEAIAKELADAWRDAYAGRMTIDVKDWQRMKDALARYDAGPDVVEEEE